jgi:hypothetical protein
VSSSEQPQNPSINNNDDRTNADEAVLAETTVTVHRAPRYRNFMLLGAVLGVFSAFAFTLAFPENAEYDRAQIFGFLLLGGVAIGATLGAGVALIIDRIIGRSHTTVVADRLAGNDARAAEPGSGIPNDDFHEFNEK